MTTNTFGNWQNHDDIFAARSEAIKPVETSIITGTPAVPLLAVNVNAHPSPPPYSVDLLAIDPGTTESAIVHFKDGKIESANIWPNEMTLTLLQDGTPTQLLCIEMVACYGMAVGREVFDTCVWIGRFMQQWKATTGNDASMVYRKEVMLHLCGCARAKDKNIRQALIDKLGAQGTKKKPGPTYEISSHMWAALAVAVYASEQGSIKL